MTRIIHCGSCGGSGYRMGTYGDLLCHDCQGEGSWEIEDEEGDTGITLADLRKLYGDPFDAPPLDQLTEVVAPPSFTVSAVPAAAAIAKRKAA